MTAKGKSRRGGKRARRRARHAEKPTRATTNVWEPPSKPTGWAWLSRRSAVPVIIAIGVIVAAVVLWPRVSLLFSPARPIVNTLSQDSVWVDPDLPADSVDVDRIRGIIGQRPLGVVVLAPDNDSLGRPLDACTSVVSRIDDITVMVVQDGGLGAGCQGDDVPITHNEFGYDFVFWSMMDSQTAFLNGDVPAQVEQLAFAYDSRVEAGDLEPRTRTFSAPAGAWALAGGLLLVVTLGVVLVFLGLRRGVIALQSRQERRRHWRAQRDDLDLDLQEIALIMLDAEPTGDTLATTRTHAAAAVSADYILLLDELSEAPMGSDLTGLRRRIFGIRAKLTSDKASGRK